MPWRTLRDWRLVKMAGYTHDEILNQPAAWLDWLLAVQDTADEAEAAIAKRKQPRERAVRAPA